MSSAHSLPGCSLPELIEDDWAGLLGRPFAAALDLPVADGARVGLPAGVRERVLERVTRSAQQSRAFITVRRRTAVPRCLSPGVCFSLLYAADGRQRRAGEPDRVRLIEWAPDASWAPTSDALGDGASEWLVLRGELLWQAGNARVDLAQHDFHRWPRGRPDRVAAGPGGALAYLRESAALTSERHASAVTVRHVEAKWEAFAPGIQRRVLWTDAGEAALMYLAGPGAQVPHHGHGRDEECLMLSGDVFLDDVLLRPGDYQLAPAGTEHAGVSTDTGLVLFAHGDLQLDLRAD